MRAKRKETGKKIAWVILINAIAWIWCSYILAFIGREQIAENLSQVAVTTIIGTFLCYCTKSTVENLSKNNSWPDKPKHNEEMSSDDVAVG